MRPRFARLQQARVAEAGGESARRAAAAGGSQEVRADRAITVRVAVHPQEAHRERVILREGPLGLEGGEHGDLRQLRELQEAAELARARARRRRSPA